MERKITGIPGRPLKVFTWHIHGSYLYYLTQSKNQFYLPVKPGRPEGYGGRSGSFGWSENVHEVAIDDIPDLDLDCILFQSRKNFEVDQFEVLTEKQQMLPKVYLEHDPPREHPSDTKHWVDRPDVLLVHVTHFNQLMWDSGNTPSCVVEHGVCIPDGIQYTGVLERGLVVVNNIQKRGRRLGLDVFEMVRKEIPLDLVGIGSEEMGGFGPIHLADLPQFEAQYRFFFNPIRYTSLGLAVCEAMMVGLPMVGLATTEMATVVENGVSGYVDTNVGRLINQMANLLADREQALSLSAGARTASEKRFSIQRFTRDWDAVFDRVTQKLPENRNITIGYFGGMR